MTFGAIERVMFLGGGRLVCDLLDLLKQKPLELIVITSPRHAQAELDPLTKQTFESFLSEQPFQSIITDNVNKDSLVLDLVSSKTLGVSVGAAWIFGDDFIKRFDGRLVNLHGARLPQDRGGGGHSWRILRNDSLGYSLIHQVDPGIDTGAVLKVNEFIFPSSCRIPADYQRYLVDQYHVLFEEFMLDIEAQKTLPPIEQPEYLSTYWPRLATDQHGYIDWRWQLDQIERFICAFDDPYSGAISFVNGKKTRLKKCFSTVSDGTFHPFQQGLVYRKTKSALFVSTEEGSLILNEINSDDGKDVIDDIQVGDRFYTPQEHLEAALQYRAFYTAKGLKAS